MDRLEGVSWEYRPYYGSYYFYDGDGEMMFMCDEVAFGYSDDPNEDRAIRTTMHKHGAPDKVKAWLDETHAKIAAGGADTPLGAFECAEDDVALGGLAAAADAGQIGSTPVVDRLGQLVAEGLWQVGPADLV